MLLLLNTASRKGQPTMKNFIKYSLLAIIILSALSGLKTWYINDSAGASTAEPQTEATASIDRDSYTAEDAYNEFNAGDSLNDLIELVGTPDSVNEYNNEYTGTVKRIDYHDHATKTYVSFTASQQEDGSYSITDKGRYNY